MTPDITKRYQYSAEQLFDHYQKKTTDMAGSTMPVEAEAYTDPERWSREMDLIFKRTPLLACFSSQVALPGNYIAVEIVGVPVLIARDEHGELNAMLNVCKHRGATVAAQGQGEARAFSCPYHGWTYDLSGRLRSVACASTFGHVNKEDFGLTKIACQERAGLVFVTLTPGLSMDLDTFLGGMAEELDGLGIGRWFHVGDRRLEGANWKIVYDGYLESYHFAVAHPETIHPRTCSNIASHTSFGPHVRIGFPQRNMAEKVKDVPRDQWGTLENKAFDFIRNIFPNVSIATLPEMMVVSRLAPGPSHRETVTTMSFLTSAPVDEGNREATEALMDHFAAIVEQEDYVLGKTVQHGLESGALESVRFGRNEVGNQIFHSQVAAFLSAAP